MIEEGRSVPEAAISSNFYRASLLAPAVPPPRRQRGHCPRRLLIAERRPCANRCYRLGVTGLYVAGPVALRCRGGPPAAGAGRLRFGVDHGLDRRRRRTAALHT